jgi:hypothetical protein
VTNQVVDMGLLTQTAEPAREILDVERVYVVADRGYFKAEDVEACGKVGCIPHVPRPQRGSSVREGFFRKDEFRYEMQPKAEAHQKTGDHELWRHGFMEQHQGDHGSDKWREREICAAEVTPRQTNSTRLTPTPRNPTIAAIVATAAAIGAQAPM